MGAPEPAGLGIVYLNTDGVSVLVELRSDSLPAVLYWESSLGPMNAVDAEMLSRAGVPGIEIGLPDDPFRVSVVPEHHRGYTGRPGLVGHRGGKDWSPAFGAVSLDLGGVVLERRFGNRDEAACSSTVRRGDEAAQLDLEIVIEPGTTGVVRTRATLTNAADSGNYELEELSLAHPVTLDAAELLDFAGHWGFERVPQRRRMSVSAHVRESRRGRAGHAAAQLMILGETGFGFRHGRTWSARVAFSGKHRTVAERSVLGIQHLLGGELL